MKTTKTHRSHASDYYATPIDLSRQSLARPKYSVPFAIPDGSKLQVESKIQSGSEIQVEEDSVKQASHNRSVNIVHGENGNEAEEEELCYEEMGEDEYEMSSLTQHHPLTEDFLTTRMDDTTYVLTTDRESVYTVDTLATVGTYIQEPLKPEPDFFAKLGQLPDIKQMSISTLSHRLSSDSEYGVFVDPLTGKRARIVVEEKESIDELPVEEEEIVESEKSDDMPIYQEFSFEDYESRFPVAAGAKQITTSTQQQEQEDLIIFFAPRESMQADGSISPRPSYLLRQGAAEQADKFLNDLIMYVTRYCEYEQSTELMRRKLDKFALFRELKRLTFDLNVEQKVNIFLNRKCVDYYRRKGNMRHIQATDKDVQDYAMYKEKVDYLRTLLDKECAMLRKTHKLVWDLKDKADEAEEENQLEIEAFENLVRKTMKCHLNPAFEKFVNTQLRHMANLREEISSTRCVIIQRQHTLATLRDRLHKMENIGNGLRLIDYETIQRDMQALDKKIEDRNRELGKMHERFQQNLHTMAHTKLKNETTIGSISENIQNLVELEEEESLLRQRLFFMNLKHKNTRRQLKELSLQSGLLDKPALLHNYDETLERVRKQRNKVQELKKTYQELEAKVKQLSTTENLPKSAKSDNAEKSKSLEHKSS